MNVRTQRVIVGLLIALLAAGMLVTGQTTAQEEFAVDVSQLLSLLDRAMYLAMTGFLAYDHDDQLLAAQRLINLIEGPAGADYDASTEDDVGIGMLASPALLDTSPAFSTGYDWSELMAGLTGSQVYVWRDAAANCKIFLHLALEAALDARDTAYSVLGPENSFRMAYACLVAARGGLDDPFLLAGVANLAALFSADETASYDVTAYKNELQDLLLATPPGGIIELEAGTFPTRVIITQDVTIQGISPEETVLEGVAWDAVLGILDGASVNLVLKDLTIRGGEYGIATSGGGFSPTSEQAGEIALTLENVILEGNATGIAAGSRTCVTAFECQFTGNGLGIRSMSRGDSIRIDLTDCQFDGNAGALSADGEQTVTMASCRIVNGEPSTSGDIQIAGAVSLRMVDCELRRMTGRAIVAADTASMTLIGNTIETRYAEAIAVGGTSISSIQNCRIRVGSFLEDLPGGTIAGHDNDITGGVCPVTLLFLTEPGLAQVTVAPGESIQAAIDAVAEGGTVFVEAGEYEESLTIARSVKLVPALDDASDQDTRGVSIMGRLGDVLISIAGAEPIDVEISGITLQGGSQGIIAENDATVHLNDVMFVDLGTALSAYWGASADAEECIFSGNVSAVRAGASASCTLIRSVVEHCTTGDAGIGVQDAITAWCSDLTLIDCVIQDNEGNGVVLGGGEESRLHMVNCDLIRNAYGLELVFGGCNPGDEDWEAPTSLYDKSHGTISGWGNRIPEPDEPDGNREGAIEYYYRDYIDPWSLTEPEPDE